MLDVLKRIIQKYHPHWIFAVLLVMVALLVGFLNQIDHRDTDDKPVFQPKQDSSRSTSQPLQLYDPDLWESDYEKEEPNEPPKTELNFSDPFSLLYSDMGSVMDEEAKEVEEDNEAKNGNDTEGSQPDNPSVRLPADIPTFTMIGLTEINQFLNNFTDDKTTSRQSGQVHITQAASNDGNRATIIGQEPDYNQLGTDNVYRQVKKNSRMNNQLITQIGRDNYAEQLILNTLFSDIIIRSVGNSNTAVQDVINGYNTRAVINQIGSFNEAYQEIYSGNVYGGLANTVNEVRQIGFSNWFRSFQFDGANEIDVVQNGNLNQIQIEQGSENSATIRQNGSGNSVVVNQN